MKKFFYLPFTYKLEQTRRFVRSYATCHTSKFQQTFDCQQTLNEQNTSKTRQFGQSLLVWTSLN